MNYNESILKHRGNKSQDNLIKEDEIHEEYETKTPDTNKPLLTLTEQIFLLGLKDREGYTSFWNDALPFGLRCSMLVELAFLGRIDLESSGCRLRSLVKRKVLLKSDELTGNIFLDEIIKHIKDNAVSEDVGSWIKYLTGETWNFVKLKYQLKHVRERVAKNLAEKGVLMTQKTNFLLFDMTTHPLVNESVKNDLIKSIKDFILCNWVGDPGKMDRRMLALILIAQVSEVLENVFADLNDDDYELAIKRVNSLLETDFEKEAQKPRSCPILWAVIKFFK